MNNQILQVKSSKMALIFNAKPFAILRPWHIIADVKKMQLTMKRRNWHFISFDEEVYAFKSVRNVKIDSHIFGADISIKVYAGNASAKYLKKKDAKKIRDILLNNDWNKNDVDIIIDMD